MQITEHGEFPDIKIIDNFYSEDARGKFIKIFNDDEFIKNGIRFQMKETYYSYSKKNVVRGMHFQLPPYDHEKIIHVLSGSVLDVIVDLRKNSPFFKKCIQISLTASKPQAIFIPKGFAHGFLSKADNTMMLYYVSSCYHKDADSGIRWDTVGADWKIKDPIISSRDCSFISMEEFDSPF